MPLTFAARVPWFRIAAGAERLLCVLLSVALCGVCWMERWSTRLRYGLRWTAWRRSWLTWRKGMLPKSRPWRGMNTSVSVLEHWHNPSVHLREILGLLSGAGWGVGGGGGLFSLREFLLNGESVTQVYTLLPYALLPTFKQSWFCSRLFEE